MTQKTHSLHKTIIGLVFCIIASGLIAILIDFVVLKQLYYIAAFLKFNSLTQFFALGLQFSWKRVCFFFPFILVVSITKRFGFSNAVKYRYLLAAFLLVYMTIGQYTGSSLGYFDWMLLGNTENHESSTLLGTPQGIRGDEWATEKPYYFAQKFGGDDFPYYNENLSFDGADMVIYAFAPVKDIIVLFRPALIGFLFMPVNNAFAFYWWLRLIMLFLASFEICKLISNSDQNGILGALIFTFSPAVRWWLSQHTTDIIVFGFYAVWCFHNFFNGKSKYIRQVSIIGVFYFLTCYILTMYPACQVPHAYILLALVIWIVVQNWEKKPFSGKRITTYLIAAIPFVTVLIRFAFMSGPSIATMLNTIYPGSTRAWEFLPKEYPLYRLVNPFTANIQHPNFSNACEISQFYTFEFLLVPIVFVLTIQHKKKMLLPALLCCFSTFLLLIAWMPQNPVINKITLLSMSYPVRMLISCGIGYTLTFIALLPILGSKLQLLKCSWAKMSGFIVGFVLLIMGVRNDTVSGFFDTINGGSILLLCTCVFFGYMSYLLLYGNKRSLKRFAVLLAALSILSTICINPMTQGTDSMFEKTTMAAIREINAENPARWIVSGNSTISNLVTAQGVGRVSGTYYYPDWTMMEIVDPDHKYVDRWNQFAHIDARLTVDTDEISNYDYEKDMPLDGISRVLYISLETAEKLGIKYVFTSVELSEDLINSGAVILRYQDAVDPWAIYEILY